MSPDHFHDGQTRIILLFGWMFVLWMVEQGLPLTLTNRRPLWPNLLLTLSLVAVNLLFVASLVFLAQWTEVHRFGLFNWLGAGAGVKLIGGVVLLDFWAAYLIHVLLHTLNPLWRIHSVHHSDTQVDVTTAFRQHPLESALRIAFLLIGTVSLGLPLWVIATYQTLSSFNAQLEHANVRVHPVLDQLLRWVFVTPNYHKVHHSQFHAETNSNYGNLFSIWDRIFSTDNGRRSCHDISYGLDYLDNWTRLTFWELLKLPFKGFGKPDR